MEGEYQINECICLVCNKILKTKGEIILHNYGDHTTGYVQDAKKKKYNAREHEGHYP